MSPKGEKAELLVKGADLTIARLTTAAIHELAPDVKLTRTGTLDGRVVVSGTPTAMLLDADVRFDDANAGRSHVVAKGGIGLTGGVRARDLNAFVVLLEQNLGLTTTRSGNSIRLSRRD